MKRRILALCGGVLVLVVALSGGLAQEGRQVVVLTNGSRIQGVVTETDDGYEVKTKAGLVVLSKDQVVRVEQATEPGDELTERLSKIDQSDPAALYEVARWAAEKDMLPEARRLLKKVLALKPDHRRARRRLVLVEDLIEAAEREPTEDGQTDTGPAVRTRPRAVMKDMLKEEDIYRIRLMELKEADRVAIVFRDNLINRFIEKRRGLGDFREEAFVDRFRRAGNVAQARYILRNTDRDDYDIRDDILIKNDPKVLLEFRRNIWPLIAQNCASPSCHGGVEPRGGFKLYNTSRTNERVVYTNFYILQGWKKDGRKIIDRGDPSDSLLLQFGLPPKYAHSPHPTRVDATFNSVNDRQYRIVRNWIKSLRWPLLRPGYRVKYDIPGLPKPTTRTRPSLFDD
jgi:hypothetical protein